MTGISVRGFAVASATAVTTVGAAVGVASGDEQGHPAGEVEVVAADATLLAEIPAGTNAQMHTASLTQQAESQADAANADALRAAQESARIQAAEAASERKAAAEREAREQAEREAAEAAAEAAAAAAASESTDFPVQSSYTKAEVQAMAAQIVAADQFQCFSNIVDHESGWDYTATNPSSGAYGLMQALPGSKMSSAGADWQTNPATQIRWGVNYMEDRYGSPCGAWEFWQANNWY
ncbi:aggregation-promoting factor C-terminal-like domain-containing protein [Streptomyces litchfieldiae]|uniref:Transglycosylase SLT domain-containing protein n=1 Tax=Streptomyces litchfieldiae TaxID=3075543 RepID=A0ABU2MN74_9ACTN|nr:transglycosylase SLT domain-containing protein [Streptomyces sp. DSM 44938]MDT0342383.1 transglycosylase SLT domain-containing protein [Streptomyces sp. DSM 44938]